MVKLVVADARPDHDARDGSAALHVGGSAALTHPLLPGSTSVAEPNAPPDEGEIAAAILVRTSSSTTVHRLTARVVTGAE